IGCVAIGSLAMGSNAYGHYPFHHYRHGGFGWGSHYYSNYYGGLSSFYGLSSSYVYPSFSFRVAPLYYSVNYYSPTYFAPVYNPPVYYPPVYYPPVYYAPAWSPCYTWSSVQTDVGFPYANNGTSRILSTNSFVAGHGNSPLSLQPRQFQSVTPLGGMQVSKMDPMERETKIGSAVVNEPGIKLVSNKPVLLQPYSPIWTKAAVGIVDDMVAAGELDHAYSSCKSMERITQPKGAGVYLRQALLSYFSTDVNSLATPSTSEILKLLELACEAGSRVQPSELSKNSLQDYFSACAVDVTGTMEQLSKSVLESPNNSGSELLLLAALLKLDGQQDRAQLF
ncbi:MAG TPA: hypothetical protein VM260_13420, partial [Pirellula sp.]|nr:hypothetical protein [Pirellula sp.]